MRYLVLPILALGLLLGACHDDDIDSDEEARRAYLGLDPSIQKALSLGFDGFNAASSANIDPQATTGDDTGTLTISGHIDQGSSDNKGMRLDIEMVEYSDGEFTVTINDGDEVTVDLTYDTGDALPYFDLQLKDIPQDTTTEGTLDGTLTGTYAVSGDIDNDVTLDLTLTGAIEDDGTGVIVRVPGTTHITGTATSGDGLYDVDVTI